MQLGQERYLDTTFPMFVRSIENIVKEEKINAGGNQNLWLTKCKKRLNISDETTFTKVYWRK